MKFFYSIILALIISINVTGKTQKVDSTAVLIMDQMSHVIGDLGSASVKVDVKNDKIDIDLGLISQYSKSELIFDGPNKMLIRTKGNKGHRGIWYNGELLAYYSFDENNYVIFDAPPTTLETIDSLNRAFGIDFPAADFLYPTFTDDLLANFDDILLNGRVNIENEECFHIVAHNKNRTVQLWISSGVYTLPKKMMIINHLGVKKGLQYEATFQKWDLNEVYPASIFEFLPPKGASEIKILKKSKQ